MASLKSLREGLAANLTTIAGYQVSAYELSSPTPPSIQVYVPGPIEYDTTMGRGSDEWTLGIRAVVALLTDKGAQKKLDLLMDSSGALSVKAKAEFDRTLGLGAEQAQAIVTECSGRLLFDFPGKPTMLGAEWTVKVIAAG